MSTNFNQEGALATSKSGEYIPFKTKYDLGKFDSFPVYLVSFADSTNNIQIF